MSKWHIRPSLYNSAVFSSQLYEKVKQKQLELGKRKAWKFYTRAFYINDATTYELSKAQKNSQIGNLCRPLRYIS